MPQYVRDMGRLLEVRERICERSAGAGDHCTIKAWWRQVTGQRDASPTIHAHPSIITPTGASSQSRRLGVARGDVGTPLTCSRLCKHAFLGIAHAMRLGRRNSYPIPFSMDMNWADKEYYHE